MIYLLILLIILSNPTNQVPTRYLNNVNDVNFIIDLMFLRLNSSEIDNHTIHPNLQYSSDHAPLTVDISIIKEFVPNKQCIIIKNSKEKDKFITKFIEAIKKLTLNNSAIKSCLNLQFANKSDIIWYKFLKYVNITKHSKA